jgi:uncharacterized membrane protein YraQ (UPF0718 family)
MKILRTIKENVFLLLVAAAYIIMFMVRPAMGIASLKNSVYYIKEMIMIMPVIFVLTALLDTWVPKEKIMKYLGNEAKINGVVLSLVLGSISAGPIYAAFPLCVMLHKKGVPVRNLIIILSAWAVVKVPMLLNEMKFLGLKFMAVRWALTVISILVFSWIVAKMVKDSDLPRQADQNGLSVNQSACMGCALCAKHYPALFGMQHKKACIKTIDVPIEQEKLMRAVNGCPVSAIVFTADMRIDDIQIE